MSAFSGAELAYLLGERHLGRLATVGADGMPHVIPVGWSYNPIRIHPDRIVSWGMDET